MSELESGAAEEWLRFAHSDLAIAQIPLPPLARYQDLCFHAQQAVEKALKGVLVFLQVSFPRTYNIAALIDLLPENVERTDILQSATILSAHATFLRYLFDIDDVDEERYLNAVKTGTGSCCLG